MYWVLALLVLIISTPTVLAQETVTVSWQKHQLLASFSNDELTHALDAGEIKPASVLKIYTGVKQLEGVGDRPPIVGTYRLSPGRIYFNPLVPFSESVPYLAVFGDSLDYPYQFAVPPDRPATQLLRVYPTTDRVPANLLKIYLEFSAPMREGEVYQRVRIYNQQDELVKQPFVPLQPELWDHSGRRVTLWLDPGRVKRALMSREAHGPVLEAGKSYILEVDGDWKDVHGQPMADGYSKTLLVLSDDRIKPETENWALTTPAPGTREPLRVNFGETMDFATTGHAFSVITVSGEAVAGSVLVTDNESYLLFTPKLPWMPDTYQLLVSSSIEDLAGNNLNRVFDRDLTQDTETPSDQQYYTIGFAISE